MLLFTRFARLSSPCCLSHIFAAFFSARIIATVFILSLLSVFVDIVAGAVFSLNLLGCHVSLRPYTYHAYVLLAQIRVTNETMIIAIIIAIFAVVVAAFLLLEMSCDLDYFVVHGLPLIK